MAWAIRQSLRGVASSESGGSSLGSSQSSSFTSAAGATVPLDVDGAPLSGPDGATGVQALAIMPAPIDPRTSEEKQVEWAIRESLRMVSTSDGTASPSLSVSTSSSSPGPSKATEDTESTSPSSVDAGSPPSLHLPEVLASDSDVDIEGDGIIGVEKFMYDAEKLDVHLADILNFWLGRRDPRGVADENATRCHTCEFNDGCEWREMKAQEATRRFRSYAASDNSSIRKNDLDLTSW